MRTKSDRHGHNKGLREVVSREYTHVGWRLPKAAACGVNGHKAGTNDARHDRRQR
jgi:hypothetical protein